MTVVGCRWVILQMSYIDYPKWTKKKKATINSKNSDAKCF